MAIIGDLTDYAKNTSGIRDYINGQYEHDGKDGEEVGIGGFTAFAQIREKFKRSASVPVTYLENGTHVNDHIIREPKTISIEAMSLTFLCCQAHRSRYCGKLKRRSETSRSMHPPEPRRS